MDYLWNSMDLVEKCLRDSGFDKKNVHEDVLVVELKALLLQHGRCWSWNVRLNAISMCCCVLLARREANYKDCENMYAEVDYTVDDSGGPIMRLN